MIEHPSHAAHPAGTCRLSRPALRGVLAALLVGAAALWVPLPAPAQTPSEAPGAAAGAAAPVENSGLDGALLYQLLVAEMALNEGDSSTAFDWILDAAKRTRDEGLFRRATDIALQSRAGEQALTATRAWRAARAESLDALRLQMQILLVLNRNDALAEPLKTLLARTPATERNGLIAALPRFLQRANNPPLIAALMDDALKPYRNEPGTLLATRVALGRAWLEAKDARKALNLAREAHAAEPGAPGPALLALEVMATLPEAESLVQQYLRQNNAEGALRQAYVRVLTAAQRYTDAIQQLDQAVKLKPDEAAPYLTLGALHLELKHVKESEAALLRYVQLTPATAAGAAAAAGRTLAAGSDTQPGAVGDGASEGSADKLGADDDDEDNARPERGLVQAWLMLSQVAEQRGDFAAAETWLSKIEDPQRLLEVQTRRATILARQGKMAQARELIRQTPERRPEDLRAKLVAEASVLRDNKQWAEAHEVLARANQRLADDADLLYEQAMVAEKLERLDDMERLLRRVIALKPDNAHAHNALGYSLADRSQRLPEAKALVLRALELLPGDPFITDSLGWVEFRLGNREEAARLLRQAYGARPDTEIGAHLGEVLWSLGQQEEARRILRESKARDAGNEVLREALTRLRVDL